MYASPDEAGANLLSRGLTALASEESLWLTSIGHSQLPFQGG